MRSTAMKVGELARRTGVSIRALHYYDEIGLLSPSCHTESGHRLYSDGDVVRLQQIKSLQQLGFTLEAIRDCLAQSDFSPQRVIDLHLTRLREQLELQQRLCRRLEALAEHYRAAEEVSVEEFLQTIEVMNMIEKYYTPEQLEELKGRAAQVGEERIRQVEAEWPQLIAQVRAEIEQGTDPADPRVQELARRCMGLINEFTGGNPGIAKSLQTMYEQEPQVAGMDTGPMREMMEYVSRALAASRKPE